MVVLTRRVGEGIVFEDGAIIVTIFSISADSVKFTIETTTDDSERKSPPNDELPRSIVHDH